MTRVALDSSCMVAAVCSWHDRHADAAAEIERRLEAGHRLTIPAHALLETYAVLTRLPAPHRLAPADAWALVKGNFVDRATVTTLEPSAHVALLARLADAQIGGGRTYDGAIAAAAQNAGASVLLTFNSRHFEPPPAGLQIVEPTA